MKGIYAEYAPRYEARGFWVRPVRPNSKAAFVKGWQRSNSEIGQGVLKSWLAKHAKCGIGLVMGSPLPDGTRLGAVDVDQDNYAELAKQLLNNPVCGRFGSKGIVYFVRVSGELGNPKFKLSDSESNSRPIAECLFNRTFCVIPPTIHPTTGRPYSWVGTSLLDVDLRDLPLVTE